VFFLWEASILFSFLLAGMSVALGESGFGFLRLLGILWERGSFGKELLVLSLHFGLRE
jgi:hypothetical protein